MQFSHKLAMRETLGTIVNMANWSDKSETKIKKYMQKYKDEYSKQNSCIVKSSKSDKQAFCTICSAEKHYIQNLKANEAEEGNGRDG